MAYIVHSIHEYGSCYHVASACRDPIEGWLICYADDNTQELLMAAPRCETSVQKLVQDLNEFETSMERSNEWAFVPAAWQVEIVSRNRVACIVASVQAAGLDLLMPAVARCINGAEHQRLVPVRDAIAIHS